MQADHSSLGNQAFGEDADRLTTVRYRSHQDALSFLLAALRPDSFLLINVAVGIEQLGYGFGFTAYTLYMIYVSRGEHSTAHFAICTGFMALGMMLPGLFSSWLQEALGYQLFFVWVLLATIPSFIVVALIPLDAGFGRKDSTPTGD